MRSMNDVSEHIRILNELCDCIFERSSQKLVLKGGTALMRSYGLNRYSEDIDLDGVSSPTTDKREIFRIVQSFAEKHGFSSYIKKDTETVKRVMLSYDDKCDPIKVEVSYRPISIDDSQIDGDSYSVSEICIMKCASSSQREKLRDMFDRAFICINYFDELTPQAKRELYDAFKYRGLAEVEASVQKLIDAGEPDKLIDLCDLDDLIM